jgi:transcriptional regulator of arginine metabolism
LGETVKQERHNAILEVVTSTPAAGPVLNQDELRRRLIKQGFAVTQATLSRDIRELRLYKGPNGYALSQGGAASEPDDELPAIGEMLQSFGLKVRQALNQLLLITASGSAQPVALAIDEQGWPDVVGTIAGDDTVLIICPNQKRATHLRGRLEEMIG